MHELFNKFDATPQTGDLGSDQGVDDDITSQGSDWGSAATSNEATPTI